MSNGATILVIDDNASHLKIYSIMLEKAGYRPVPLQVGIDPVSLPTAEPVDLVLLDYRLPGRNTAVEVAKSARLGYGAVPIIVLSDVMWMPEDMAPHAASFVRKGEPEQLLATVADLLANRGA